MMRTRSPSNPRMVGRLELGPKSVELTPGKPFNVWPRVLLCFFARSSPRKTLIGEIKSLISPNRGFAVTTTGDKVSWA